MTRQDTSTDTDTDDSTRRIDLRTLDRHASPREVYAALGCPYPGGDELDGERRIPGDYGNVHNPSVRGSSKVRDSRAEGTGGQVPVPSCDDGLNIPFATDGCAVRRRVGSSGFETDEYARYDRTNGGEEYRTVTDGGHEPTEFDVVVDVLAAAKADEDRPDAPRETADDPGGARA